MCPVILERISAGSSASLIDSDITGIFSALTCWRASSRKKRRLASPVMVAMIDACLPLAKRRMSSTSVRHSANSAGT